MHVDGRPEQCAEVAAAVVAASPATAAALPPARLIAFDQSWDWHVDLVPGITAEQVLTDVVQHDEQWHDPELEGS